MFEQLIGIFPQHEFPSIASDPFVLVVDALVIAMFIFVLADRARRQKVGFMGSVYCVTLIGFIGSFIWIWDRFFYGKVPAPQFALWSLKDVGVCMGLAYLIWRNWRRGV